METARKYVSILLLLVLCVTFSFSAFAAPVATPSQIQIVPESIEAVKATPSQISPVLRAPAALPSVSNTIDLSDVSVMLNYYNLTGTSVSAFYPVGSDGHFNITKPDNYSQFIALYFILDGSTIGDALPPSGNYQFNFKMGIDAGGVNNWGQIALELALVTNNASTSYKRYNVADFLQYYGDFYLSSVVDLANASSLRVLAFQGSGETYELPMNGQIWAGFSRTTSSSDVSMGDIVSSDDVQADISSGVQNIEGSIRELIQTIINQLDALWNQFAGEFTNMFAAWQTHTDAIVSAIQNITTTASDGIENIIQAGHNDADQISEDIQDAENQITNGYDNSAMTSDNDRLDSSLQEYDSAEDALISDAEDAINGVDFTIDLTSFSGVIATISGFLQDCYENSGQFQIVINLALLCSLASCVIGLYRFKGGG